MASDTAAEALEAYVRPVQRALACISRSAHLTTDCHDPKDGVEHFLTQSGNDPIRVATVRGNEHYLVTVRERFRIVQGEAAIRGSWKVATRAYEYSIAGDDGAEILDYHWHPGERGFNEPHMHVAAHPNKSLEHAHLPTGRLALESFVAMTIREFNVRAQDQGYRKVLESSQSRFEGA